MSSWAVKSEKEWTPKASEYSMRPVSDSRLNNLRHPNPMPMSNEHENIERAAQWALVCLSYDDPIDFSIVAHNRLGSSAQGLTSFS
jgi:hypothetical protein